VLQAWKHETSPKYWRSFFHKQQENAYRNRHYLLAEWPQLAPQSTNGNPHYLLECGCGVGSAALTLCEQNPDLHVVAFDFCAPAVDFVRADARYGAYASENRISVFVHSLLHPIPKSHTPDLGFDFVTCIFVLSALRVPDMVPALRHLYAVLKDGGQLMVRDYVEGDMKEEHFVPGERDEYGSVFREDGTRSYFFTLDSLQHMAREAGFTTVTCEVSERTIVNHKEAKTMHRRFIQATFRKLT
jgi:methyltransferase-like protein 6